ncbi:MAG: biotin synthase BioB [Pseudomonadota bacterium]
MTQENISYTELIHLVESKVLAGGEILRKEAELLLDAPDAAVMRLAAAADAVRTRFKGNRFDACSLINARSGRCSEDCAFCAQSGRHDAHADVYGLRPEEDILAAAHAAQESGASRFCTVTSGGALSDKDFASLVHSLETVRREVDLALDASLGFLDEDRARQLSDVGVTRYNHNLETSREHYPAICTTHSFDQRVETVRTAMQSGFSACSGGIIGLGETPSQRLDLAFTLAELGVDCVPINILDPRPGTPLEHSEAVEPMEIIRTIALFRMILPKATIKIAGGRERNLGDFQGLALRSGANGMIIGGYLTTAGRSLETDLKLIRQAGFQI